MKFKVENSLELKLFDVKEFEKRMCPRIRKKIAWEPYQASSKLWRNLDENNSFKYVSQYDIPQLDSYNGPIPPNLIAYCDISRAKEDDCPHFYIDDTRIPAMGNNIEHFTKRLRKFQYVIAPDYTMYCGAPLAVNLRSLFLNRSIAAYWQEHGLQVIPSFNGGDAQTFDYCLAGMPKNSIIACGNVGVKQSPIATKLWRCLVEKAIAELTPTALLIYGTQIDFTCPSGLPVYWYPDFINTKFKR
jgi:hypothetical protein